MHIRSALITALIGVVAGSGPVPAAAEDGVMRGGGEQTAENSETLPDSFTIPDSLKRRNTAFGVGEYLEFEIAYGPVTAGTATMAIPDTQWVYGRPCYHVVTTAVSNKFVDTFFKVRDRVESFIDMEGYFPWRFKKHLREGKYSTTRNVEYFQWKNLTVQNAKDSLDVPPFVHGVLSSFYITRLTPLKVRTTFDIRTYADDDLYDLRVLVHKKDRVRVPAGEFDCIVVEPVLKSGGLFKQEGRMAIWLTDDERRMPVLMKSKALIGTIDARLVTWKKGAPPDK